MQQYADIYLLQSHSTCFGLSQHPSSGVLKTVTASSGTGHNTGTPLPSNVACRATLEGRSSK